MTGAMLPHGTEAVVPVEWTDGGRARVAIRAKVDFGASVRLAGGDAKAGEVLVAKGSKLRPMHIAVIAAAGVADTGPDAGPSPALLTILLPMNPAIKPKTIHATIDMRSSLFGLRWCAYKMNCQDPSQPRLVTMNVRNDSAWCQVSHCLTAAMDIHYNLTEIL